VADRDDESLKSRLRLPAARALHHLRRRLPWIGGALGVAALCGGVVVLFASDHDARTAFLLTLGVALLGVSLLGGRVQMESFELFGARVRVREVVKRRLELAESTVRVGDEDRADLQKQALVLQELAGLYGLYEHIRRVQPPGPRRTGALEDVAELMREAGHKASFDPAEVKAWFRDGTDPLRVIALNLMLVNEDYRDLLAVLESIDRPHSLFEQYYGMLVAEEMLPLDPLQERLLGDAIRRAQRKRRFKGDPDLPGLGEGILEQLASGPR
jgi:hypothetical protein